MKKEKIILVNKKDKPLGTEEKLKAHLDGKLHRAFSILIFNSQGKMLIQQRAKSKYHSPNLWANTCCSHPRPKETLLEAVKRRLKEEVGIECDLKEIFSFIYKAKIGNLIENEFDHVFVGKFDGDPTPNKEEIQNLKWINLKNLKRDIKENEEKYTFWFKKILTHENKFKSLL